MKGGRRTGRPRDPLFAPLSPHLALSLKKVAEEFKIQEGRYPSSIRLGIKRGPFGVPEGHRLVYETPEYKIKIEWVDGYGLEIS